LIEWLSISVVQKLEINELEVGLSGNFSSENLSSVTFG
jgi:hypothetical protein